jgi:membrane-bound inhibitor of C-type lysozyme
MKIHHPRFLVLVFSILVFSCGKKDVTVTIDKRDSVKTDTKTIPKETFVFECNLDSSISVSYMGAEADSATVIIMYKGVPGETLTLKHVQSGSGARYSDGEYTFWNKGDDAIFERKKNSQNCKLKKP